MIKTRAEVQKNFKLFKRKYIFVTIETVSGSVHGSDKSFCIISRFYTLLVLSTALFGKAPFKNLICHGLVLAS